MPLTSGWVVLSLALLTLVSGLLAASVLRRSRGVRRVVVAAVAVLVVTALLLVTVLAASNRALGWVRTTSDLTSLIRASLSPHSGDVELLAPNSHLDVQEVAPSEALPSRLDPSSTLTVHETPDEAASGDAASQGVRTVGPTPALTLTASGGGEWTGRLEGEVSGITTTLSVWGPPGWTPSSTQAVDVVVFLHGYPGTDHGPAEALGVPSLLPRLTSEGTLRPTIFVVPNLTVDGHEPDCLDVRGRPQVETLVVTDLVRSLRATVPHLTEQRSGWVLAGISAGAWCAPLLALRHTDQFWGGISLGGYDAPQLGSLAHADAATRAEATISRVLARTPAEEVNLYFAGTRADSDTAALLTNIGEEVRAGENIAEHLADAGGHTWSTWAGQLPDALTWWGRTRAESDRSSGGIGGARVGVEDLGELAAPGPLSLRGWGSLALAGLLALAALALLARSPGRRAPVVEHPEGGARESWVRAVGLLAVAVLTAALVVLLVVNCIEVFFSSWGDLARNWHTLF